ncbi:MAG: sulfotransferase domain-containing protein [Reichenbachiella sp.]|uniref:sulfotransferase domain-containing protein n=1 Tax=Reichenbachiella sp. TaxID=2184521 RepID=UPI00329839DD
MVFEATPNYIFHPQVAKRIFQFDPNIKLISIVRNPTERALSAWIMHHFLMSPTKRPNFFRTFKQTITEEIELIEQGKEDRRNIVKKGLYYQQFVKYYELFDKKNLLIIENEDLLKNCEQKLSRIFQFLGVAEEYLPLKKNNVSPKRDFKSEYKNELALLDEYYYPENQKFYKLVGQEFNWD